MPEDLLPTAKSILSYYLPFQDGVGKSNIGSDISSPVWANAYSVTNTMAVQLNLMLVEYIKGLGYDAATPGNPGRIAEGIFFSNWSQRHIAYAAGHGSFGLNNMLITERGCCGRYFSIVTTLPFADEIYKGERCLYKRNGGCKICVKRCLNGALTTGGFDRELCSVMGDRNAKIYNGSTICGKCVVGLPCSNREP
jgi:epoxyqueuosine reductase QueG